MSKHSYADFTNAGSPGSGLSLAQTATTTTNDEISCATTAFRDDLSDATSGNHKRFVGMFTKSATNGTITMSAAGITLAIFTPIAGVSREYKIECDLWYDNNTSRVKAITTLTDYTTSGAAVVDVITYETTSGQTTTLSGSSFTFDVVSSVNMDNTASTQGGFARALEILGRKH